MIDLSVVIVNYNVSFFLEQCLHSVLRAAEGLKCEIFVVDNNSVDESVAMVRSKFPQITLIANTVNTGFSKANNQGIALAQGRYVLLLNPDTLVEEDTFLKCVDFMDNHPDGGGLGVKMVDGRGRFLPESKRGLPTPSVAFYKIFGLSALFPKSKLFGKYHLGFLAENDVNEVDVLSGAYMFLRKTTLDQVGVLDEAFFMYGEDIDLSYRITLSGFKNYYFPLTRIIHYKGESTKKSSVNYVFVFYRAMIIFAEKHFSARNASSYSRLIHMAIYFRASLALINRFIRKAFLPVFDAVLSFLALVAARSWYAEYKGLNYESEWVNFAFIGYVGVWLFAIYLSGGYDKPVKLSRIIGGILTGSLAILAVYALLPETYRFSRALILIGTLTTAATLIALRLLAHFLIGKSFRLGKNPLRKIGVVARDEEYRRIARFLESSGKKALSLVHIAPGDETDSSHADTSRLKEVAEVYKLDTLIFSGEDVSSQSIISMMAEVSGAKIEFKIAPPESLYIIGSNSVDKEGELFIVNLNSITKPQNLRKKATFDWCTSLLLLLSSPISVWFVARKGGFFANIWSVLTFQKSWVSYHPIGNSRLPKLKVGVLNPLDQYPEIRQTEETARKLNTVYARDYSLRNDLRIVLSGFRFLGSK